MKATERESNCAPADAAPTLVDTHSHIYGEEFDADREQVVCRAREAGVGQMLLPAIDSLTHERLFDLSRRHAGCCTPMMGLHPTSVNNNPQWRDELACVERWLAEPPEGIRFCAVGEIGLDLYWSAEFRSEQIEAFRRQIDLALQYGLPIAVHVRNAWPETIELLRTYAGRGLRGVMHAFTDTVETYRTVRELGNFAFGIGGVVTFRKSPLAEVVREMELDDLVLETDAPYLTPVPHRGTRNESAYVSHVCDKVAEIKGLSPAEVAARTSATACRIFGLEVPPQHPAAGKEGPQSL